MNKGLILPLLAFFLTIGAGGAGVSVLQDAEFPGIFQGKVDFFINQFSANLEKMVLAFDKDSDTVWVASEISDNSDEEGKVAGLSDVYAMQISISRAYAEDVTPVCVALSANPQTGSTPLEVKLTGSGQGESLSYKFEFGDGEFVTTVQGQVAHIYQSAGKYNAILRVISGAKQSDVVDACKVVIDVTGKTLQAEVVSTKQSESGFFAGLPAKKPPVPVAGTGPLAIYLIVGFALVGSGVIISLRTSRFLNSKK